MKKYFIAGDIHSFWTEWQTALLKKGFDEDNPDHIIIICGDLWDRGDDSLYCYQFVAKMLERNRCIYIRGNHEDLLQECLKELDKGIQPRTHHWSNGTIKTLSHFMNCSPYDVMFNYSNSEFRKVKDLLNDFIDTNCLDYYELGPYIFVHSWIPVGCEDDYPKYYTHERRFYPLTDWKHGDWDEARWGCPFDLYQAGLGLENRIIVCGHWHTSYAFHKDDPTISEWGSDARFDIYKKPGIIGLDGCVTHTHKVNILVIEEVAPGVYQEKVR